jgi:hypothetical protein
METECCACIAIPGHAHSAALTVEPIGWTQSPYLCHTNPKLIKSLYRAYSLPLGLLPWWSQLIAVLPSSDSFMGHIAGEVCLLVFG